LGRRDRRWRRYWDDANAMLQAGVDSRAWVLEGLEGEPRWSDDRREQWAERAAIMEIDGTLARHDDE
jgi:hypothetical protein